MKKVNGRISIIYNNTKYVGELVEYSDWNSKNFAEFLVCFYEYINEYTKIKLKLEDGSFMLFGKNVLEDSIIHLEEIVSYND